MGASGMKRGFGRGLVLALMLALMPAVAGAQKLPEARIGILDIDMVMRDSATAKDIRRQIDGYRSAYQVDIKKAESKLKEEEATLKRQRASLAPAAFAKRRTAFEKRVIALQRKVNQRTKALDTAYNKAMAELRKPLWKLLDQMSKELGYNLVIDNRHVFIKLDGYDITRRVVARLDKTVPKVKVAKPATK